MDKKLAQAASTGLLELLRELLELERRLAARLRQQRQQLIDGEARAARNHVADIRRLCGQIAEVEARRQTWTARFCAERALDITSVRLVDLVEHPDVRVDKQELLAISSQLRDALQEVADLRDQVQALAEQAKAYSDWGLQAIRDSARRGPYVSAVIRGGHFIDMQS